MNDEYCKAEAHVPTIRERIEKMHALLSEAISIEEKIVGSDEGSDKAYADCDVSLGAIESELDRALGKCRIVVDQLNRIAERL